MYGSERDIEGDLMEMIERATVRPEISLRDRLAAIAKIAAYYATRQDCTIEILKDGLALIEQEARRI